MKLGLIGFVIGIILWFCWKVPVIGFVLVFLLALGAISRFRLVAAFVVGFIIGLA
jgi:hypothetical protein